MSADTIEKITHFKTPDGVLHDTLGEASKYWNEKQLLAWFEARMPASQAPSFTLAFLKDWTISPRRGGV